MCLRLAVSGFEMSSLVSFFFLPLAVRDARTCLALWAGTRLLGEDDANDGCCTAGGTLFRVVAGALR